jgi:hypothetical protein
VELSDPAAVHAKQLYGQMDKDDAGKVLLLVCLRRGSFWRDTGARISRVCRTVTGIVMRSHTHSPRRHCFFPQQMLG